MLKHVSVTTLALSAAMLFAAPEMASAQKSKKLSYEQAMEDCRKTAMVGVPDETVTSAARSTRAAACMKKHGYRLKK